MFFRWDHNQEADKGVEALRKAIGEAGGNLYFEVTISPEGWVGQCKEFPAIVTGSSEVDPSDSEIMTCVLDALRAAFNISNTPSFKLDQLLKTVNIKREMQVSLTK